MICYRKGCEREGTVEHTVNGILFRLCKQHHRTFMMIVEAKYEGFDFVPKDVAFFSQNKCID